jgi:hypothetical protein
VVRTRCLHIGLTTKSRLRAAKVVHFDFSVLLAIAIGLTLANGSRSDTQLVWFLLFLHRPTDIDRVDQESVGWLVGWLVVGVDQ